MAETKIEWTGTPRPDGTIAPGYTFNGWIGCAEDEDEPGETSPECANCYAREGTNHRVSKGKGLPLWGTEATRQVTTAGYWRKPLQWDREAAAEGARRKVFCQSLSDVCEDFDGPLIGDTRGGTWRTLADVRAALWALIEATPHLDWLLLTKRPQNVLRMVPYRWNGQGDNPGGAWPRNGWVGTTAGTQRGASRRVLWLIEIPAPVLFVSYEPALEAVDFTRLTIVEPRPPHGPGAWLNALTGHIEGPDDILPRHVNWLITGGESGSNARPMDLGWARSARDQCKASGTSFFFKQQGVLRKAGEFASFVEWVNKAKSWIGGTGAECYDAKMRRCLVGKDFMRARDEGTFPVSYWLRAKDKGGALEEIPEDLRVREFPTVSP